YYSPQTNGGSEQNWAITMDNRGIMYFGNDANGVLEYDGSEWRSIPIPNNSIVRSLACAEDGTVYVGAVGEFGYLEPDHTGLLKYKSLVSHLDSTNNRFSDVWKTSCTEGKVYFQTEKNVYIYHPEQDSLAFLPAEKHSLFGFYQNGNYYLGDFLKGLMLLQGDSVFVNVKGGEYYISKDIYGLCTYDENTLLICAAGSGLSLYDIRSGKVDPGFASESTNRYLNDNFLTHLAPSSNGTFIASTINGGIVVLNRKGEINEIVSSEEGLHDQTIYSTYQASDTLLSAHLWLAQSLGIGKINLNSSIRSFSEEFGINGLITAINTIEDRIFIGTTTGIYASRIEDNAASFEIISNIMLPVWDLEKYILPSGETVLLAIGHAGFFRVHKNGKSLNLKSLIQKAEEEHDPTLWGYSILNDPMQGGRVYLGMVSSIVVLTHENGKWVQEYVFDSPSGEVRSMAMAKNNKLWFGTPLDGISSVSSENGERVINYYGKENGLPTNESNSVFQIKDDILVGTSDGIYRIFDDSDTTYLYRDSLLNSYFPDGKNSIVTLYSNSDSILWISFNNSESGYSVFGLADSGEHGHRKIERPFMTLDNFSVDNLFSIDGKDLWFTQSKNLFCFDEERSFDEQDFSVLIRRITINNDSVSFNGTFSKSGAGAGKILLKDQDSRTVQQFRFSENNIKFEWSAPFFENEDKTRYSYLLEGFSNDWSKWSRESFVRFTNLSSGKYVFQVKAKNVYHSISTPTSYVFRVLAPWYFRWYAVFVYLIVLFFIAYFIYILLYYKRLQSIVSSKTQEVIDQRDLLMAHNKGITDSINYAKRIQSAVLPTDALMHEMLPENFVLFKPRDIVSGDFYWIKQIKNFTIIVAADCTGHGVPGAFMSMLGVSMLNELVSKSRFDTAGEILDRLRRKIKVTLSQTGVRFEQKDGLDLALIILDSDSDEMQYAGAYNPLYILRKKEAPIDEFLSDRIAIKGDSYHLIEIKADRQPIAIFSDEKPFKTNRIKLNEGDSLYMFSDGYADQIGGPDDKKFMIKNFKMLLLGIQDKSMSEQKAILEQTLQDWKKDVGQLDDILVMGIRWSVA
ncbi:MAG: SpoIIE family protein phosphatase, partial [Bacteroidales bacterium]|nr:SpoIIE family protein phosphatase [Bacteroidales bacterium]